MIDNFDNIRDILDFSAEDTFYYIEITRRKKENPKAKHAKIIDTLYIDSMKKLNKKEEHIKDLCKYFNARAYIRLNRRDWYSVAMQMYELCGMYSKHKNFAPFRNVFSKACGNVNYEDKKIWVIDVDYEDYDNFRQFRERKDEAIYFIKSLQDKGNEDYKIITELETENGIHIISNPFNSKMFNEKFPEIGIHKDNPTLLYIT